MGGQEKLAPIQPDADPERACDLGEPVQSDPDRDGTHRPVGESRAYEAVGAHERALPFRSGRPPSILGIRAITIIERSSPQDPSLHEPNRHRHVPADPGARRAHDRRHVAGAALPARSTLTTPFRYDTSSASSPDWLRTQESTAARARSPSSRPNRCRSTAAP